MPATTPAERNEVFQILYELGWTEQKIARAFGLSKSAVNAWKRRSGIPSRPRDVIDFEEGHRLHAEGASDPEIASKFGVTQSGVVKWRQRHGLSPNISKIELNDVQKRQIKQMLKEGGSAWAIGRHVGCNRNTVLKYRRSLSSPMLRASGRTDRTNRIAISKDDEILARITKAIGQNVPEHIREQAIFDLYGDLYEGKLVEEAIEMAAPRYRSAAYKMCGSTYEHSRLDAENNDGLRMIDTLADEDWEAAFERLD